MSRLFCLVAALAVIAGGCSQPASPPVAVSDVRVLAPVPGSNAGVAYMTVTNNSDRLITIGVVSSPQFDRVEMHETTLEDGVSRMRALGAVEIEAGAAVEFAPGGKHLMLMGIDPGVGPGSSVQIELAYGDGMTLVSTTMLDRLQAE
jgi:copper(I)-binding protein